jgi:hypothetical protein
MQTDKSFADVWINMPSIGGMNEKCVVITTGQLLAFYVHLMYL